MERKKIVLKGQNYAMPHTESVEIKNQGVLCGSGGGDSFSSAGTNLENFRGAKI